MGIIKTWLDRLLHRSAALGRQGEDAVYQTLTESRRFRRRGKVLRNLYIPRGNGETTEIDLLYITRKGLFVIESKNYSAQIFGHEQQANWTAAVYAGKSWLGRTKLDKYTFYNPIVQNKTHIHFLKAYLKREVQTFSVIVFSDSSTLRDVTSTGKDVIVCRRQELLRRLGRFWWFRPNTLSKAEIAELCETLAPLTRQKRAVQKKHIRDVKKRTAKRPVCPRCGRKLVLRGADSDHPFYGCTGYPLCKYTRALWQS